jgi:bifunctional non-homologous end joining protein LigD
VLRAPQAARSFARAGLPTGLPRGYATWVIRTGEQGLPARMRPMLATAAASLPLSDGGWAYEMKWDGLRALAYIGGGSVRLWSRSGKDISGGYPELAGLAAGVAAGQAVLDGEIVAFGGAAWPSFEAIQQRMNLSPAQSRRLVAKVPVTYLAFDLLSLGGRPLLDELYSQRRALLEGLGLNGQHWQTPPSFTDAAGPDVLAVSRQHGLEGVMAKRLSSRYEPGRRSQSWRKIKNVRRQEAVVGGWKPGEGGRAGQVGSLLLGVQGPDGLDYAGHVGTGFTQQTLAMLGQTLAPLRRGTSPFAVPVPPEHARGAVWVEPLLVVEVAFSQWTSEGRMRAASYKGLRPDKDPGEVVREP